MKVTILRAGYCTCPEHLAIQGGRWRNIRFPAMFALFEHARYGPMLFDTGYSYRFFKETQRLPDRLYRWLTPVTLREADLAANQLAERGIRAADISHVFISHFHADHIAALQDFSKARFVYLREAYETLRGRRGLRAMSRAFLPNLVPTDFDERSQPIGPELSHRLPAEYAPFESGYDFFGDESITAIPLPGHATGQMGLCVRAEERNYFFVADAAWLQRSMAQNRAPARIADLLFDDPAAYRETLRRLHEYGTCHSDMHIIPSHCDETLKRYCE